MSTPLYCGELSSWRQSFDAWHLMINVRSQTDPSNFKLYPEFDDHNVWRHNVTFCYMARDVLSRIKSET